MKTILDLLKETYEGKVVKIQKSYDKELTFSGLIEEVDIVDYYDEGYAIEFYIQESGTKKLRLIIDPIITNLEVIDPKV